MPVFDQPALFYVVAAFAVFFVALAKAGFGGIIGSLAMPLVAAASDTITAVAVLFPAFLLTDVVVVWTYRRTIPWDVLWPMLIAGSMGTLAAIAMYGVVDPAAMSLPLGVMAIISAVRFGLQTWGWLPSVQTSRDRRSRPVFPLVGWCGSAGFFSFFLMGAVPAQIYLLPFRLDPMVHVSATVGFFATMNWSRVPVVLGYGIVTPQTLWISAALLPIIPLGIVVGRWITANLRKEPFFIVAQAMLFVLGIYLIASAVFYFTQGGAAS